MCVCLLVVVLVVVLPVVVPVVVLVVVAIVVTSVVMKMEAGHIARASLRTPLVAFPHTHPKSPKCTDCTCTGSLLQ